MDECGPALANDVPPVINDMDVGAELKAKRKSVGLSRVDVAQELRIDVEQVHGLENNQYDGLSSAVFVKGYVRNYARLVGLDPAPLIVAIESGVKSPALASLSDALHSSGGRHGKDSPLPVNSILTGVAIVLAVGFLGFMGEKMYQLATGTTAGTTISLPTAKSTNGLDTPLVSALPNETEERLIAVENLTDNTIMTEPAASPVIEKTIQKEPVQSVALIKETPKNNESTIEVTDVVNINTATVTLHFAIDSWAEVYDAEKEKLVSRIGKAGSTATVEGVPPFSLVLGFAPGVRVEYNGESVDVLSRTRGNVARLQVGKTEL